MNSNARKHLTVMLFNHRRFCESRVPSVDVPDDVIRLIEVVTGSPEPSKAEILGDSLASELALLDAGLVPPLAHDLADAGRLLGGVSESTVRRLIAGGELEAVSVAGRRVIARSDINAFLDRQRKGALNE